jgi:transposase InsO family protein
MSLRLEFAERASVEGANVRALCREYEISPPTAYKWLARYRADGPAGLRDRSRRPLTSPTRTGEDLEQALLQLRAAHPAWGGRKLRAVLRQQGQVGVPSASTITAVLQRQGRIDPATSAAHRPYRRFVREHPNELWQLDFKGPFTLPDGTRAQALSVIDDHSRFCLGLTACANQQTATVQGALTQLFRTYGCPERVLTDNGSPWGDDWTHRHTRLTVWLLHLDIPTSHGAPYHPQTQGKVERFHRTLKEELLAATIFPNLSAVQTGLDGWRDGYNTQRPHEALGLVPPAERYQPSPRVFPEHRPPIEYPPGSLVRKVQAGGELWLQGRTYRIASAFQGYPVALTESDQDGILAVYFRSYRVGHLDLRAPAAP